MYMRARRPLRHDARDSARRKILLTPPEAAAAAVLPVRWAVINLITPFRGSCFQSVAPFPRGPLGILFYILPTRAKHTHTKQNNNTMPSGDDDDARKPPIVSYVLFFLSSQRGVVRFEALTLLTRFGRVVAASSPGWRGERFLTESLPAVGSLCRCLEVAVRTLQSVTFDI